MTREKARRRAMEAAVKAWSAHYRAFETGIRMPMDEAIAAYERAMADAGWRMVRVVDADPREVKPEYARGWNACRRAMLGDDE